MRRVRSAAIAAAITVGTFLPATSASATSCVGRVEQAACTVSQIVCSNVDAVECTT